MIEIANETLLASEIGWFSVLKIAENRFKTILKVQLIPLLVPTIPIMAWMAPKTFPICICIIKYYNTTILEWTNISAVERVGLRLTPANIIIL